MRQIRYERWLLVQGSSKKITVSRKEIAESITDISLSVDTRKFGPFKKPYGYVACHIRMKDGIFYKLALEGYAFGNMHTIEFFAEEKYELIELLKAVILEIEEQ